MSAYVKGRRLEYKIMALLKEEYGCDIVARTAKSHSVFDVVGIDTKYRVIRFVQCKAGKRQYLSKDEREKLEKLKGVFAVLPFLTVKNGKFWELKQL